MFGHVVARLFLVGGQITARYQTLSLILEGSGGPPLCYRRCSEAVLRFVRHQQRNQFAASVFRKTPERRETSETRFAFCLSPCNVLSCKVRVIQVPRAKERAAFDGFPHSIDYHGPPGLSSNSRARAVNQPVAQRFSGRKYGAECAASSLSRRPIEHTRCVGWQPTTGHEFRHTSSANYAQED